jgi:hypothetical protein
MPPKVVEVVFVLDASESMRPCIQGLIQNLDQMLRPLQGFQFRVRVGFLGLGVGKAPNGQIIYRLETMAGGAVESLRAIYGSNATLFCDDPITFSSRLRTIELGGDEDHLLALDCAIDFPFGPVSGTRRVVALFSDERIEDGLVDQHSLGKIGKIVDKLTARKILLFAALPESAALAELGSAEGCQIETVSGGDGLANVDFRKLLAQMAKTISVASMQGTETSYPRAIFGQNQWTSIDGSFDGLR